MCLMQQISFDPSQMFKILTRQYQHLSIGDKRVCRLFWLIIWRLLESTDKKITSHNAKEKIFSISYFKKNLFVMNGVQTTD